MTIKRFGIKGFDKNLKCKDHQYRIGETYTSDEKPVLCRSGFHYCQTLTDCYRFYSDGKDNRYCVVEILGDIDHGIDKSCTNKMKIIREVTKSDIDNKKASGEELSELCEYGFAIGGSTALRIHGFKIDRPNEEVDLVIEKSKYDQIKDKIFVGYKEIKRFSGMDSVMCYISIMGYKYDILIGETNSAVDRVVDDYSVRVQDANVIWEHKLKYALNGSVKHMNDIRANKIEFMLKPVIKKAQRKFDVMDDLPY